MFRPLVPAVIAMFLAITSTSAHADLLTFDDIVPPNSYPELPPVLSYGGLDFSTSFFQSIAGPDVSFLLPDLSASNGTQFYVNGYSDTVITGTGGTEFVLNSFDLGLSVYTPAIDDVTVTLNYAGGGSSFFVANLTRSFDTFVFSEPALSSLVISTPASNGGYLALDNISINNVSAVPEPASMTLLGTGLLGFLGIARRLKGTLPT